MVIPVTASGRVTHGIARRQCPTSRRMHGYLPVVAILPGSIWPAPTCQRRHGARCRNLSPKEAAQGCTSCLMRLEYCFCQSCW